MSKISVKRTIVKVSEDEGNFFAIRGLSPYDLSQLLAGHRPMVERLVKEYASNGTTIATLADTSDAVAEIALSILAQVPLLAAQIIAMAADDADNFPDYLALPIGLQVSAITDVALLTFGSPEDAKRLFALALSSVGKPAMSGTSGAK